MVGGARLAVCEEEARTFDPDDTTWRRATVRRGQRPGQGAQAAAQGGPFSFFAVFFCFPSEG